MKSSQLKIAKKSKVFSTVSLEKVHSKDFVVELLKVLKLQR